MSKPTSAADCITAAAKKNKLSDEEAQKILNDIAGTYVVAGLIADTLEFTIKRIEELYAKVGLGLKFDNKAKANRCKKLTEELRKSYFDMVYRQTADDNAERRASTQEALTEFTSWFTYMCYLLMQKSGLGEERNTARMQILTMLQNNFEDVEHLNMELLRKELL